MKSCYSYRAALLRFGLLLPLVLSAQGLLAQSTPYAPTYAAPNSATSQQGCVEVKITLPIIGIKSEAFCGATDNIDRLADNGISSFTSYASLTPPVLPASYLTDAPKTSIKVRMASLVKAGSRAGMAVSGTGSLADITLDGGAELVTYNGGAQKEIISFQSLVGSNALSSVPMRLDFIAKQDFDNLEIRVGGTINAYTLRAYYVYAFPDNSAQPYKGVLSRLPQPLPADAYDTQVRDKDGLALGVNSTVQNPENAVSESLTDFATFTSLASVSQPAALNVRLSSPAAKNYQAGFVVGSSSLLDVNVLSNFRITTFLDGKQQETSLDANLLEVNLLPDGKYQVSFPATLPFDHVALQQVGPLATSVLSDLNVYYGFGIEQQAFRDQNPRQSKFETAAGNAQVIGSNGLLCVTGGNCGISNAANAADNTLSNYASISTVAAVGGTNRLRLRLNGTGGAAGNRAGVVLTQGAGLLDAALLPRLTLRTYAADGTTLVETASGASILGLSLFNGGQSEVSFLTTQPFGWVEVEVPNGLANVLTDTRLYYAFADDARIGFPSNLSPPTNPLPVELVAFTARATARGTELTWKTASELNNRYFAVERSVAAQGGAFREIGRVAGQGTSATGWSYAWLDAEATALRSPVAYYRLRQVDEDNTESLSPVVAVVLRGEWWAAGLQLAPNPATVAEPVRVQVGAPAAGQLLLVYDVQGRLVSRQYVDGPAATLATGTLRQGLYQIVLTDGAGQRLASQRLVVANR